MAGKSEKISLIPEEENTHQELEVAWPVKELSWPIQELAWEMFRPVKELEMAREMFREMGGEMAWLMESLARALGGGGEMARALGGGGEMAWLMESLARALGGEMAWLMESLARLMESLARARGGGRPIHSNFCIVDSEMRMESLFRYDYDVVDSFLYFSDQASVHESSIYNGDSGYGMSGWGDSTMRRTQKMRVLKQFDWIKEQLYWRDIISVTDNLYKHGHLKLHELDEIQDRYQPRRKAAANLLKIVLRNQSTVSAFLRFLESKSHLLYIAERINKTKILPKDRKGLDYQLSQWDLKTRNYQQGSASDVLEKMYSSLKSAKVVQELNNHARKHLGLEFEEAVKRSTGITFVFSVVEPCQELKHQFAIGPDMFAQRLFQTYCDLDDQDPQQPEL